MKKFKITETLSTMVEANNIEEVEAMYKNEDIVLDSTDFIEYKIEEVYEESI